MTSILQQARNEGYRNGASMMSQCHYDEAYYEGQQAAWAEAPSRFKWWVMGVFAGIALSGIWGSLT